MAFSAPVRREMMLTALREADDGRFDEPTFLAEMETIEAQGYEIRRSYVAEGVFNVRFPVIGSPSHLVAALTGPYVERHDLKVAAGIDAVKRSTMDAATKLSTALGASEDQLAWRTPDQSSERA